MPIKTGIVWSGVALAAVSVLALALYFAWRPIAFLVLLALVAVTAALLNAQLRAVASLSGAHVGPFTWCLMAAGGIYAFQLVSVHVWEFTDNVIASAAAAHPKLSWEDVEEIRFGIDLPANGLAAFYLGPIAVLLIRDLVYRVRNKLRDFRKEGAARRAPATAPASVQPRPPPPDVRLFHGSGEGLLPVLPPEKALARSRERLRRLKMLAEAPHLSDARRKVIRNLVRAQAAIVEMSQRSLKRLN